MRVFIDALSYLTENDNDKFRERLTSLLERWPDTDMTPMAGNIMKGLKAGRVPRAGLSNSRGMIWSLGLSNDSIATDADGQPANFERNPDAPQHLVLDTVVTSYPLALRKSMWGLRRSISSSAQSILSVISLIGVGIRNCFWFLRRCGFRQVGGSRRLCLEAEVFFERTSLVEEKFKIDPTGATRWMRWKTSLIP